MPKSFFQTFLNWEEIYHWENISLMNILKRCWPSTGPCGTPHKILSHKLDLLLNSLFCILLFKQIWTKATDFRENPYAFELQFECWTHEKWNICSTASLFELIIKNFIRYWLWLRHSIYRHIFCGLLEKQTFQDIPWKVQHSLMFAATVNYSGLLLILVALKNIYNFLREAIGKNTIENLILWKNLRHRWR